MPVAIRPWDRLPGRGSILQACEDDASVALVNQQTAVPDGRTRQAGPRAALGLLNAPRL
jgi:hypothetical protein